MQYHSITATFSVEGTARADIMLTTSRVYYRFATADTCEEGEIPFTQLDEVASFINQALSSASNNLMPTDVSCSITLTNDNEKIDYNNSCISHSAYNSLINIFAQISEEFIFIKGFK